MSSFTTTPNEARRRWMGVLAKADPRELEAMCDGLGPLTGHTWLRAPETGLVMVRARIGGTGAKFNVGEMTLTRCALRLHSGGTGVAYVQGRSARHAELAAIVDALMQDPSHAAGVEASIVAPLEARRDARRSAAQARAATTRVDFYTVARAEAA